eukprot:4043570-Pleurochrysis_carterae.AAC.3
MAAGQAASQRLAATPTGKRAPRSMPLAAAAAMSVPLLLHVASVSGAWYSVLEEPAWVGTALDRQTGKPRTEWVLKGKLHEQHMAEGIVAAALTLCACCALIVFEYAARHKAQRTMAAALLTASVAWLAFTKLATNKMPS